jgi:hypothetical protein
MRLATLLLLATTLPAQALSCLPPDAVRLYEAARDATEIYYMVRGRIDLMEPANVPLPDSEDQAETRARISGMALGSHSFGTAVDREITISTHCLGPWCGSPEVAAGELFATLRVDGDRLILRMGPCGGDQVPWDKDGEARVLACHRDNTCNYKEF